ncbi:MerR family transcriptional regulator [Mycobacterium sp. ITM-2016-00317]|uniref:MerR family transcriptional regulator n=1 Tax=Mycobacterium sp. ITM-2016-00317 TaxID=2099694 RepID=UPI00287F4903|nr:MerR family transcriptional regulator [Mycobacterium sp. ITM-2016-00317]WNG86612.1 MerR family transcriptional regulator [Mycobacterium sp. ITM-2016-00317]
MTVGVTIGQAAAFADITIKTVRHYHKLGLVDEPSRDGSGYRRYGSADLLRLVQVRTLAVAGVPLADIAVLLDSEDAQFADELADVERHLTACIAELIQQRDMLRRLTSGDRTLLPDRAIAMLEGMPSVGFAPDDVQTARESFVLAKALVPEGFDDYLTDIEHALSDPRFLALIKRSAELATWAADDPRVAELAGDMAEYYLANPERLRIVTGLQAGTETATRYRLIAHHGEEHDSATARFASLVEARLRTAGVEIPRSDPR